MTDKYPWISDAFRTFLSEAPEQAQAWGTMVQALGRASSPDAKTAQLAGAGRLASSAVRSMTSRSWTCWPMWPRGTGGSSVS